MKKIQLLLTATVCCMVALGQPGATEGTADYQRTTQPAAIIELPYPPGVVEKAISDYMSKNGVKGSSSKGFTVYRG